MHIEVIYTSDEARAAYGDAGPQYATAGACAIDLRAMIEHPLTILTGEQAMIPTGIKLHPVFGDHPLKTAQPPVKLAGLILPRSGKGSKEGLVLGNTVGLCDEDYQGEVMICAWARPIDGYINPSSNRLAGHPVRIEPGERIAQMMFVPAFQPAFRVVSEFSATTARGDGGFGHSGSM